MVDEVLKIPGEILEMNLARAQYEAAALAMLKMMARGGAAYSALSLLKDDEHLHRALMTHLSGESF